MWVGLLIFYVANVANVSNVRPSKDPPCPSLKGRELFSPFKGEIEGVSGQAEQNSLPLREGQGGSSFWAYLPNNLPKNVVPLQRNFKTLQYHESPNIAVKGATQPKEIPPNCSFLLPLLR